MGAESLGVRVEVKSSWPLSAPIAVHFTHLAFRTKCALSSSAISIEPRAHSWNRATRSAVSALPRMATFDIFSVNMAANNIMCTGRSRSAQTCVLKVHSAREVLLTRR